MRVGSSVSSLVSEGISRHWPEPGSKAQPWYLQVTVGAIEPAAGERNAAVRATVAHGEDDAVAAPSQHQRNAQQHRGGEPLAAQAVAAQRGIPVVIDQRGRRRWMRADAGAIWMRSLAMNCVYYKPRNAA